MAEFLGAAERLRTVDYLKRKARNARLQAVRAAPVVSSQLRALALLIEAEAQQLEKGEILAPALKNNVRELEAV